MNKLKTTDVGGHPIELDDFRWFLDGIDSGFKGILDAFSTSPYILSGCNTSLIGAPVSHIGVDAGFVSINGEVLEVVAHQLPIQLSTLGTGYYWTLDVTYDSSGLEFFKDGIQRDTYEVRRAKVVYGSIPVGASIAFDSSGVRKLNTLKELIALYVASQMPLLNEATKTVGGLGNPAYSANWSAYSNPSFQGLSFFKDVAGITHIEGAAEFSGTFTYTSYDTIFILPAGYRPSKFIVMPCSIIDTAGAYHSGNVLVYHTGQVQVNANTAITGTPTKVLMSISFRAVL